MKVPEGSTVEMMRSMGAAALERTLLIHIEALELCQRVRRLGEQTRRVTEALKRRSGPM
jgi:hypothetical protein